MTLVLIVDDVPAMAEQYAYDLKRLRGYETLIAKSGRTAAREPDARFGGLRHSRSRNAGDGRVRGVALGRALWTSACRSSSTPARATTTAALKRSALGAYSFIDKAEPMERVAQEVENAIERRRLKAEGHAAAGTGSGWNPRSSARAPRSRSSRRRSCAFAPVPSPVVIVGESGTGKELVARELHRLGPNPKGPFVALNSAALPHELVESELFGHEARRVLPARTPPARARSRRRAVARCFWTKSATCRPPHRQSCSACSKRRKVTRLGRQQDDRRRPPASSRRHTATSRRKSPRDGFREDLFYRLNVHVLRVPPLRDRLSDVPALAEYLVAATCARFGMRLRKLSPDAISSLMGYDWRRNNIRELRKRRGTDADSRTDGDELTRARGPCRNPRWSESSPAHRAQRTAHLRGAEAGSRAADRYSGVGAQRVARHQDREGAGAFRSREFIEDHAETWCSGGTHSNPKI